MMLDEKSDTDISKSTGISTTTLRTWRRNFALPPSPGLSSGYSKEIKEEALRLMKQNQSNKKISDVLKISTTTIANWRKAAGFTNPTKYSNEIKTEAISQMKEGHTNAEINRVLGVHRDTLSYWRKKAGLEPSKGGIKRYTIDQINDVIDLIRDEFTIGEIEKKSGVARSRIKDIYDEEIRSGNKLPELKKGIARRTKYSDEELIELAFQNHGFGFNQFCQELGVSKEYSFELFVQFKEYFEEDPYAILQKTDNHKMVKAAEYLRMTGKKQLPVGYGHTNGNKVRGDKRNMHKMVPLPPQEFKWGLVEKNESL